MGLQERYKRTVKLSSASHVQWVQWNGPCLNRNSRFSSPNLGSKSYCSRHTALLHSYEKSLSQTMGLLCKHICAAPISLSYEGCFVAGLFVQAHTCNGMCASKINSAQVGQQAMQAQKSVIIYKHLGLWKNRKTINVLCTKNLGSWDNRMCCKIWRRLLKFSWT